MSVDLTVIRFRLQREMKYLSSLIFRIKYVPTPGIGTFGVDDRNRLLYDPEVDWSVDEQVTALYHEMNHLLRGHHKRMLDRDPKAWNVAADCEIDDDLPPGWDRRSEWMYPSTFGLTDGLLAEEYYANIAPVIHFREDATATDPGKKKCTTPGCDSKDKQPRPKEGLSGTVHVPIPQCFQASEGSDGDGSGSDGSGDGSDQGGSSDSSGGISDIELESIRHHIAKEVAQQRGKVPAGLERWANDLLNPKVPWSKLLRTAVRRSSIIVSGYGEKTYAKPRRREVPPYVLPKQVARLPQVAIYVDTSGSITEEMLNQAFTEIRAAIRTQASSLFVTPVDAKVYDTYRVQTAGDLKRVRMQGGGGTDMRLCFEHVKTIRPRPNLMVIITDGYTPWPQEETPGVQTVVVLTTAGRRQDVPAFAKVVVIDDE